MRGLYAAQGHIWRAEACGDAADAQALGTETARQLIEQAKGAGAW